MVLVITFLPGMALALSLLMLSVPIILTFICPKKSPPKSILQQDMLCSEEDFKRFKLGIMRDPSLTEISIPHMLTRSPGCLASQMENGDMILTQIVRSLRMYGWDYITYVSKVNCPYCQSLYPIGISISTYLSLQ